MKLLLPLLIFLFVLPCTQAETLVSLVGDKDNMGGAIPPGGTSIPGSAFDNRSTAELNASNGAQLTDFSGGSVGTTQANPTFTHIYNINPGATITSATFVLGAGGIQSNNDRLFLDGVQIASGNDFPEQGGNGYSSNVSFNIPSSALSQLLDGTAAFRVNLNSNNSGEPVVFDFAELIINGNNLGGGGNPVPEPTTITMTAMALLLGCLLSRRRNL